MWAVMVPPEVFQCRLQYFQSFSSGFPVYVSFNTYIDNATAIATGSVSRTHDDVIKWKHFPRNWPFVRRIRRSPVYSPHRGQWRGALMFSLICVWINGSVNNREAGDLRRYRAHYDVTVMTIYQLGQWLCAKHLYDRVFRNKSMVSARKT